MLTDQQPPPGIYLNDQPSYYFANGSKTLGPVGGSSGINVFLNLTTAGWTSPWTVLGANYGMSVTAALVHTNGSLDLSVFNGLLSAGRNRTVSGFTSTYVEPINLGWHAPRFDVVVAFGVFAPSGSYNPQQLVNVGLGLSAEMFSAGGAVYLDIDRIWSVALESRYLTHQSQQGKDLRAGDDLILEGGVGREFDTGVGPVNVGLVSYGYWQVTNATGSALPPLQHGQRSHLYALGPEVAAITKYGLYYLRFFSEFGAANTFQGHMMVAGVGLAF